MRAPYSGFKPGGKRITPLEATLYWEALEPYMDECARLATTDLAFRGRYTRIARHLAADCWKYVGMRYGHKIGKTSQLRVRSKWDYSKKDSRSRGGVDARGRGYISINMIKHAVPFDMIEYSSFAHDLEIGYLCTRRREVHLAGIIAHEVAHAAVFSMKLQSLRTPQLFDAGELEMMDADGGHGPAWKSVYRYLRTEYVTKIASAFPEQSISRIWSNS